MPPVTVCRTLSAAVIRHEPNPKARIAATLQPGAIIHVDLTRSTDGWFPVQVVNGWVSGELFEVIDVE